MTPETMQPTPDSPCVRSVDVLIALQVHLVLQCKVTLQQLVCVPRGWGFAFRLVHHLR